MNREEFKDLWDRCIEPSFEKLKKQDAELYLKDGSFDSLCVCYNEIKNRIKRMYMQSTGEVIKLDRHKVASALVNAILLEKPIFKKVSDKYSGSDEMLMIANEALAFTVALSVLKAFIRVKIENNSEEISSDREAYVKLCAEDFAFPKTIVGVEYPASVCWAWHHNMLNGHFDVLGTANLFFMLEKYSVEVYRNQL